MAGYRCLHPETGFPAFAFRLHQFISRGDNVYASLGEPDSRFVTVYGQQFVPGDRSKILLPIVFCRECGQEYYCVRVRRGPESNQKIFEPRDLSDRYHDEDSEAGILYHNPERPWPESIQEIIDRIPNDWLEEDGGNLRIKKSQRRYLPERIRIGSDGRGSDDGFPYEYTKAPFRLCLNCGISYGARQTSDIGKLTSLGTEGRSTATTILSLSAVRRLILVTATPHSGKEEAFRSLLGFINPEFGSLSEDLIPGSDPGEEDPVAQRNRRLLLQLAREAEDLKGKKDIKLQRAIKLVKDFIRDGFQPILFCRFIPTAEYVAEALRGALPRDIAVSAVTGTLPPAEREHRIAELTDNARHVLVCTDCLSEGINLQEHFDAVMHYDLSWNPTRHEQRKGRVDRFGQPRERVRVLTYYGWDNQIDGIVLDVLLRKHKKIKSSLGISVPVPGNTEMVVEAIFEGLLLKEKAGARQLRFDFLQETRDHLHAKWDDATAREKRSRTMFAQESIKVEEVSKELSAVREAIGSSAEVADFVQQAFKSQRGVISPKKAPLLFDISEVPRALKDALGISNGNQFRAKFELPVQKGVQYLNRTHPLVEALANYVMNTSLDPLAEAIARRCGAIRTRQVERRTTLLLVRFRYHHHFPGPGDAPPRRGVPASGIQGIT